MSWVTDSANTTTLTNDSAYEAGNLTIDEMIIAIDSAEGTIDSPRTAWTKDSANTSTLTNDSANA